MGRPPKGEGEKFETPIRRVRMSDDEWGAIVDAATANGETASSLLRRAAAAEVRKIRRNT